ncbi:MAG: GAK system CofD-like protein [Pseudomonadales bacterium]|nr:GAK system CofD-like protein [Pseudomonadales bacterium]
MTKIRVTRTAEIPDPLRISRYYKMPEFGPRILFFSGGTAINGLCQTLKNYTHNSIHLVTSFDSGGSSAKLRQAFQMPAIGDLRNRLMALADDSILGHPEIYELFSYRFAADGSQSELLKELQELANNNSSLISDISNPMRQLICNQLGYFLDAMPEAFDLRGASLGNLILAGGYLNNHENLDPIIFLFSKLINVQGTVRAIVNKDLQLGADLEDGRRIIGQHQITGKEVAPLSSPIKNLFLSESLTEYKPTCANLRKKNRKLIESADLICYPPGSYYSSVVANLLPKGVGSAVASNDAPKIFIPNLGSDPEQVGMDLNAMIATLLEQLKTDAGPDVDNQQLLNFVLMDTKNGCYPSEVSTDYLTDVGVELIDTRLVSKESAPYYDNQLLVSALLSLT